MSLEAHVLARTAYGPDAWSRQRIAELGVDAFLEEQLRPEAIDDGALGTRLAQFGSLPLDLTDLTERYAPGTALQELLHARVLRSVLSRRQLEQILVDFWFDHFNIYVGAGSQVGMAVGPYERDAIRPNVLGTFSDLLLGVAHNVAMLYYLDNYVSVRPGYNGGVKRGLNENYARELLELHTVGSGYTQQDVTETARAFTGWTAFEPPDGDSNHFYFQADAHDPGAKRIMGLTLPAGQGIYDGIRLIGYLGVHQNTGRQVCSKLIQRFVSETPPARLVEECTQEFVRTGGRLYDVTRLILFSSEFRDPAHRNAKVKRPQVFASSLLRTLGVNPDAAVLDTLLVYDLVRLGEKPYFAHPPSGYPDVSSHWTGSDAMLARFRMITRLSDSDAQLGIDWGVTHGGAASIVDALALRLLGRPAREATRSAVIARVEELGVTPDPKRVREAAALLLASPEFMQH